MFYLFNILFVNDSLYSSSSMYIKLIDILLNYKKIKCNNI